MLERFVDRELRRTNRNLLVTCSAIALITLGLFGVGWRYFYNFFAGPAKVDPAALAAISDPGAVSRYFVQVDAQREIPTGLQEITVTRSKYTHTERSRRVSAEYKALIVGERMLIAKTPSGAAGPTYTGSLVQLPKDLAAKLGTRGARSNFMLPYMLDATGFRGPGYFGVGIGGGVLLLCGWGILTALRRQKARGQHPLITRLSRFGDGAALEARLNDEADKRDITTTIGDVVLTPSFLLRSTKYGVTVVPLADLIWAHGKVTRHSTNGIPTGKTFAATVHDRLGTQFELACKEDAMTRLLGELSRRAPWAIYGHSPEIEARWRSNRAEVVAAVDTRRQGARGPVDVHPV